jgi:hypothetical protein
MMALPAAKDHDKDTPKPPHKQHCACNEDKLRGDQVLPKFFSRKFAQRID